MMSLLELFRMRYRGVYYLLMIFVLVDETRAGVNVKLELERKTLESRGFRLNRVKTEYIECKFSKQEIRDYSIVKLDGQEIP